MWPDVGALYYGLFLICGARNSFPILPIGNLAASYNLGILVPRLSLRTHQRVA